MFQTLKEKLNIVEVMEEITGTSFKNIGENTYASEDDLCVFCGHKGCARIKMEEDSYSESFYHCFSESKHWDVIALTAELKEISPLEAANLLAKHYKIELPRDHNPVQAVMNMAAQYYQTCFLEAGPCAELSGSSPLDYQKTRRGHSEEFLNSFLVGWSDGKLIEYLESLGVEPEIIKESGLANKAGKDFFPGKVFIYPHKVKGRVSHFTFKDPLKQKEYQLPNKSKLNGHSFYNSDSTSKAGPVIVVEGENDAISVAEAGWESGVICCNGSISASQLDWMVLVLKDRDIITVFDSDEAGDKYRSKVAKLSNNFKSLLQIKLTGEVKDIDQYLKEGGLLEDVLSTSSGTGVEGKAGIGATSVSVEVEPGDNDSNILEKNGAYYKVRYKDGNEFLIKITNFTIKLLNIFIRGMEREREIMIRREDGKESSPFMIQSEAKVSLKPFKTLAANAIDASFYGKEDDLISIWEHVYKTSKEVIVHLPQSVGRITEFGGWLFGDCFISETGATYMPDDNGVIWISNKSIGLRPVSMETGTTSGLQEGIPKLLTELNEEQRGELLGGVIENLASNLGDTGMAISMLAWAWASVHSDEIFKEYEFFPSIYSWGRHGMGKTTINKWLLALFDIDGPGWNPVNQLNSGVSFTRKLSYYSSLPMCVDEMKLERPILDMYGMFRSWYNRGARTVSAKDAFGVKTQPIRSTIFYGGEDQFADGANRERCLHFRIPKLGRENVESFKWIADQRRYLPSIGYQWIVDRSKLPAKELIKQLSVSDSDLRSHGVPARLSRNWSVIAVFGKKLADKYLPEFKYMDYLYEIAKEDVEKQKEDSVSTDFWELIEGLQAEDRPKINSDHLKRVGNELHIWFNDVFRIVQREELRGKDSFSKRAIMEGLKDEPYFLREGRTRIGMSEVMRRVIILDIPSAPEVIQQIASFLE